MRLFIRTFALLWTLIFVTGSAVAAETMTLNQCLKTGLKNNPALRTSRFNAEAAGEGIKAARNYYAGEEHRHYPTATLELNLLTGGENSEKSSEEA